MTEILQPIYFDSINIENGMHLFDKTVVIVLIKYINKFLKHLVLAKQKKDDEYLNSAPLCELMSYTPNLIYQLFQILIMV